MAIREITRTIYVCDICGGEFQSKAKAEDHHDVPGYEVGDEIVHLYNEAWPVWKVMETKMHRTPHSRSGYCHSQIYTIESPSGERKTVHYAYLKSHFRKVEAAES